MSQALRQEYPANGGPPPGQGYYNQYPESGYDDRFEPGPRREPGYVPYQDSYGSSDREPPPRDQYGYGSPPPRNGYDDRPYAPTDPQSHEFNQLSAYDEDKADAGWREYESRPRAYSQNGPPSGYVRGSSYDDRYYNDRDSRYDDRYDDREHDRRRRRRSRRRSDEDDLREKALRYPSDPKKGGRDFFGASEGERGVGAQLLGGVGGAMLGRKFRRDHTLGAIGGAVVGAIAASAAERQYEKRKEEKVYHRRDHEDPYVAPAGQYPPPGRDMDDVRDTGRDGRIGIRERLRYLSRGARSRMSRSRSRPRRSPSVDSEEAYHYR